MKDECKVSMYEFSLKDFPEPGSTDRQLQRLPWTIGHHVKGKDAVDTREDFGTPRKKNRTLPDTPEISRCVGHPGTDRRTPCEVVVGSHICSFTLQRVS